MKLKPKFLWTFVISAALLVYSSCRKTDQTPEQKTELTKISSIEERFFNSNRTSDPTEKNLVDFIRRKNDKEKFVEKTVKQIGYPRWDKIVTTASKSKTAGRGASDSSLATYYLPFVRDSQNYVNASMIIKIYPSDTTFSYKCDWQYSLQQNNLNSYSDSAEYFAIFFMVLDKAVFGHTTFDITDEDLFKHNGKLPLRVKLDSLNTSGRGNLLAPIEYCQDVIISWQDCPFSPCSGEGGSCDNCPLCTSSISYTYCWTQWVETGGGGTGGSGGTGGGGGTGSGGGGSTPPECEGGVLGRNYNPCGGGWEPIPIDDEPGGGVLPASLTSIDVSSINDPCLQAVIQNIGAAGHNSFILKTYFAQNFNTTGAQKKYKVKYLTNTTLTGNNGQPISGQTNVTTLADGTNEVEITLNPSFFQATTKEWVTTIILHELLHGIILVERPDLNTSLLQHVWMFNNKAPLTIAQSLMELFPGIDAYNAIALGMDGMSEGYTIPNTNTIDPAKDAFAQQNYFQNINQAISTASNYQNAVAGFGNSFC